MDSLKVLGNCCCCSLFSFKSSLCTNYFVSNLSSILYPWFVLKSCPRNYPLHRCIHFDHCDVCISFILLFLYLCPRLLVLSQYYYCPPGFPAGVLRSIECFLEFTEKHVCSRIFQNVLETFDRAEYSRKGSFWESIYLFLISVFFVWHTPM